MDQTPISYKEARAKGIRAKAPTVVSNYSHRKLTKRDIADNAYERFDAIYAAELLGELTGGRDPFCGKQILELRDGDWVLSETQAIQWDHLIPVYYLGLSADGNICPICSDCNQKKSCQSPFDFQQDLLDQKRAYLTADAFESFHRDFSKKYKAGYKKLFKMALGFARDGAEESEVRAAIPIFLKHKVTRGGKEVYAIRVSAKEDARESSPSRDYFDGLREIVRAGASSEKAVTGQMNAILNVQVVSDELYGEGVLTTPILTDSLGAFQAVAMLSFERDLKRDASEDSKTIASAYSKTKAVLTLSANISGDSEIIDYAKQLPSYAMFRDSGMLAPLSVANRANLESLLEHTEKVCTSFAPTLQKLVLSKHTSFEKHLRVELNDTPELNFVDLSPTEKAGIAKRFLRKFESSGVKSATIYCNSFLAL